uniref:Reverse transcriptase domain-containing protein n=1 Tax=Octopus bimaculoides TaxID=37653 RepID=A0A0L8I7W2_OCTBM
MRGAECWTEHRLVRGKIKSAIKPKCRQSDYGLLKRLTVNLIKEKTVRVEFQHKIENLHLTDEWMNFRRQLYSLSKLVLGVQEKKKNQDWFDESDGNIQHLLENVPTECLDVTPSVEKTIKAVSMLNYGKAPGVDSLNAELFKFREMLIVVIQKIWKIDVIPKDWKDAVIEVVFKVKGQKGECNDFRGICLPAEFYRH